MKHPTNLQPNIACSTQELVASAVMWQERAAAAASMAREAALHRTMRDEAVALQERAAAGYGMARWVHGQIAKHEARLQARAAEGRA
jgi:hypothetical protein